MSKNYGFDFYPDVLKSNLTEYDNVSKKDLNKYLVELENINNRIAFKILVKPSAVLYIPDDSLSEKVSIYHKNVQYEFCGIGVIPPAYNSIFHKKYTTCFEKPIVFIVLYFCKTIQDEQLCVSLLYPVYENRRQMPAILGTKKRFYNAVKQEFLEKPIDLLINNAVNAFDFAYKENKFYHTFGRAYFNVYELLNVNVNGGLKSHNLVGENIESNNINHMNRMAFYSKNKNNFCKTLSSKNVRYYYPHKAIALADEDLYIPKTLSPFKDSLRVAYIYVDDALFVSRTVANTLSVYSGLCKPALDSNEHIIDTYIGITKKGKTFRKYIKI